MTAKRALWVFVWLFLGFFVISDPERAALMVHQVVCVLELAAQRVAVFVSGLF